MSKCIIFYVSQHHQNTEKLLKQAIGGEPLAELVPLTDAPLPDLSQYSLIGLASGVYMGEPHAAILAFLENTGKTWQDVRSSPSSPADPTRKITAKTFALS